MKTSTPLALTVWLLLGRDVFANLGLFTYYETPLSRQIGGVGPSWWRDLIVPGNQCGGIGQTTGFGQSPIVIPDFGNETCDSDLTGYVFEGGTCDWDQLWFRTLNNGVIVSPAIGAECTLGRMKIPGNDNYFDALQYHIHTSSEHSVDGKYYPNELHVVHRESNNNSFAVFGTFIDADPSESDEDHPQFEYFLQGWEAASQQTDEFCALNPEGSGIFVANSVLASRQMKLQCPAPQVPPLSEIVVDDFTGEPVLPTVDYPATVPNIYQDLPADSYGIYSYRGGLTTPPCTEIVNWNLLDTPMRISVSQLARLTELILCFVERSTCKYATVANEFGFTNRPPQPLNGRRVMHRCASGPSTVLADETPPVIPGYRGNRLVQPFVYILYPWFVAALGLVVFYLLSRYLHFLPFTAVMFLIGTGMGIGMASLKNFDQLTQSIRVWSNINSELLLLAFLPGLLFRDSYSLEFHLFKRGFWQCVIMAFPMVLAGTALLACVGYYVLPYGWSFSLAMTFGAILSATDPVAVSALLNEVGAPPRLKVHISGESLLNDGSAIVFFTIFASKFFFEIFPLAPPGTGPGQDIDVGKGIAIFFRMSLGAVAIGLAFGLSLIQILYFLNRRFNAEESIVQVTATITLAYLTYYVADVVCRTSGVIAVVTCGIMTNAFASTLINDNVMMEKFWVLVEHLLNTVLFALGGVVWGTVISNRDITRPEDFNASDWGYLFLVYILMTAIRFFLVYAFLPIISRIGLKSNWKEAFFISFGGLRGAVGIALAIALDNELSRETLPGDPRRRFTSQLFGLTGGIAFLTLFINGTLAGPVLRKLGLCDLGEMRNKIVHRYRKTMTNHLLDRMLQLLGETRYHAVDYAVIYHHIPYLKEVTDNDLKLAVKRNRDSTPLHEYQEPYLESLKPFLKTIPLEELTSLASVSMAERLKNLVRVATYLNPDEIGDDDIDEADLDQAALVELRKIFIELLRRAYREQMEGGELDTRQSVLVFILDSSLSESLDRVSNGEALCDWDICEAMSNTWLDKAKAILEDKDEAKEALHLCSESERKETRARSEQKKEIRKVHRVVAFVEAHRRARVLFKQEFCSNSVMTANERKIFDESLQQAGKAEALLDAIDQEYRENILSHLVCSILLNEAATFIGHLVEKGLMREQEAEHYVEEIEEQLHTIEHCHGKDCVYLGEVHRTMRASVRGLERAKTERTVLSKSYESGESSHQQADTSEPGDSSNDVEQECAA